MVLTGPGSYSGVRAGMAAALGVASARHLPLHGAGNLLAVAAAAKPGDGEAIVAVADAGRGGVYLARFVGRGGRPEQVSDVERHDVISRRGRGNTWWPPPPSPASMSAVSTREVPLPQRSRGRWPDPSWSRPASPPLTRGRSATATAPAR